MGTRSALSQHSRLFRGGSGQGCGAHPHLPTALFRGRAGMRTPRFSLMPRVHVSQAPGLDSELLSPAREVVDASLATRAGLRSKEGWTGYGQFPEGAAGPSGIHGDEGEKDREKKQLSALRQVTQPLQA